MGSSWSTLCHQVQRTMRESENIKRIYNKLKRFMMLSTMVGARMAPWRSKRRDNKSQRQIWTQKPGLNRGCEIVQHGVGVEEPPFLEVLALLMVPPSPVTTIPASEQRSTLACRGLRSQPKVPPRPKVQAQLTLKSY